MARHERLVVVGVLHDLNLAARFGDGLVLLHQGRVIASGPRDDVLTPANIAAAFRMVPTVLRTASGHPYLVFE